VALGKDAAISMFIRDGTMLARHPHADAMIGQKFEDGAAAREGAARAASNPARAQSRR